MKFPVLSMLITKTMPELSDLMHLEWYKKPPTGPYSGSWWLPRSPFCLCLPACSSPQPGPLSSLQAPALHLLPHGASRGWVMPPLSDTHPPVSSRSWSVFQCFCTFTVHVCFGKTSIPEEHHWETATISEMVHTVPLTRMTHLLNFIQCQPTFCRDLS